MISVRDYHNGNFRIEKEEGNYCLDLTRAELMDLWSMLDTLVNEDYYDYADAELAAKKDF